MELCLAWGELQLFQVPAGGHVWGREFQILPSGTMGNTSGVLHGLIGIEARPIDATRAEVQPGSPLLIYGTRGTDTGALRRFQDELADGFNAQAAQRQA